MNKKSITEAVRGLDPNNDQHWTTAGLPHTEAVGSALGEPITRADITAATEDDRESVRSRSGDKAAAMTGTDEGGGDPKEPAPGGGMERDPETGKLVPSTAATQIRAASQARSADAPHDGPEPDQVRAALDMIVAAASSPRYRRNQQLNQIATLYRAEQTAMWDAQDKFEGRTARREERREQRRERAEAEA